MTSLVPQRTHEVPLYTNEDQHEIDRLQKVVQKTAESAAASGVPMRIGDDEATSTALADLKQYANEAAERGVKVEIKAIGRKWRSVVAEHPAREKNADDAEWGWNVETLADAVVPLCIVAIGGQPVAADELQDAVDSMSDGDFSRIYSACVKINTGRGPDPTELNSIVLPTSSPETSESPERLG